MRFRDAYRAAGYELDNYQTDWSAKREDGVAISIWWAEVEMGDGRPYFDTRRLGRTDTPSTDKRLGAIKRRKHIRKAWDDFDGWVDAIILMGIPGNGYGSAEPWNTDKCGGGWRISWHDDETGHFVVELVANAEKRSAGLET